MPAHFPRQARTRRRAAQRSPQSSQLPSTHSGCRRPEGHLQVGRRSIHAPDCGRRPFSLSDAGGEAKPTRREPMPGWGWVLIAVAVVIAVALVVWRGLQARRTRTLQDRFGPEYDRTVERTDDRREAEADLAARAKRRDELDIRPLPAAARERYLDEWQHVQARFVDDPRGAVEEADALIQSV